MYTTTNKLHSYIKTITRKQINTPIILVRVHYATYRTGAIYNESKHTKMAIILYVLAAFLLFFVLSSLVMLKFCTSFNPIPALFSLY